MRAYGGLDLHQLAELKLGMAVETELVVAASEDEADELETLEAVAQTAPVVVAVDVPALPTAFTLADVEALHIDPDDSGHLQWFARQEIDDVIDLVD